MREPKIFESGKSPLLKPKGAPDKCAFCDKLVDKSPFVAFTAGEFPTALCSDCIRKFSKMLKFMEHIALYAPYIPDYLPLKLRMLGSMAHLPGSPQIKQTVVNLCIRILQRTSAIIHGELSATCPKTGVSLLKPKPIILVGKESTICGPLFEAACEETGTFFISGTRDEISNGIAFKKLLKQANTEATWAEHGIIYCEDRYVNPMALATVVFGSDQDAPSEIEKLNTD